MLALDYVSTVRVGRAGPIDSLADLDGLTAWAAEHGLDTAHLTEERRREVVELRQAVRALFAKAVAPGAASSADAARLPAFGQALDLVNAAALAVPTAPQLVWTDGRPRTARAAVGPESARLTAELAGAAVEFLAGPQVAELRSCPAPRCVLYFVKEHPRQEWCSVACGNRARAARHYRNHK